MFLSIGLGISIVVEWLGMIYWWPEQGASHAYNMMATEINYLRVDFKRELMGYGLVEIVSAAVHNVVAILAWFNGFFPENWSAAYTNPIYESDGTITDRTKRVVQTLYPFAQAAYHITILYTIRLTIIVLSIPLIIIVAFVALWDGLCERELRKDGAGRESTDKFSAAKNTIKFVPIFLVVLYLSSPWATHPNFVLTPIALSLGILLYFAASNYKKYW